MLNKLRFVGLISLLVSITANASDEISWQVSKSKERVLVVNQVNLDFQKSFWLLNLFANPRLKAVNHDYYAKGVINNFIDNYEIQRAIDLREIGIEIINDYLELGFGKKIFNWSQVFELNPTDVVCSRDFTDVLNWERIGMTGAWLKTYFRDWGSSEGIVSFFTPARLPVSDNHWFVLPKGISLQECILPKNQKQYSGKISANIAGFDINLLGHYGYNPFAYFQLINILPDGQIVLRPVYYRRHMTGLSASRTLLLDIVFRTEAAYFVPETKAQDDSYVQTVLSLERFWPKLFRLNNLHLVLQYSRERIIQNGKHPSPDNWARIFKNHLGGQINLDINPDLKLYLKSIYNLDLKDSYLNCGTQLQISDKAKLNLSADVLSGAENSFFGQFDNQDRIKLNIEYLF